MVSQSDGQSVSKMVSQSESGQMDILSENQKKILEALANLEYCKSLNYLYDRLKKDMAKATFLKELKSLQGIVEIEKQKNRKIIKLIPILEFEEKTIKNIENMLQNLLNEVKRKIKKEKHKFDMICFVKSAILGLIGSRLLAISTLHKDEKVKKWLNLRYLDILTKTNHKLSELLIKEYGKKLSKKYLENELKKGQEEIEKLFKH
jgi:hypothetical protein